MRQLEALLSGWHPVPHEDCPMAIALAEGQAIRSAEGIIERPDGTRSTFIAYPTPLRDTQGNIIGGMNMLLDITDRKRAEAATAFLASIVSSSHDAIIGEDLNGVISSWNESAERLFGYTAEEAIGQPITMLMPPERLHEATMIRSKIKRGEPVALLETVRVRKDGSQVIIASTTSPIKDSRGQVIGASKVIRDITERKRAHEAVQESEQRFRTLFELAPMAIFVCDQDGVIQNYNVRAAELWGRHPACGEDKHCGSVRLWLPDGTLLPHDQSPIVQVLRTGEPALNNEVFMERPDGSFLPVLANFGAFRNAQGEIVGAVGSFTDITQRKKAEETMRQAKESLANQAASLERLVDHRTTALQETVVDLEAFSYSVAHDMRAPLRAMQGMARLLIDEHSKGLDATALGYLDRIIRSSQRLDLLIQDVLSYTKILRAEFPLEPVDLDHLIRDIISSYADFHSTQANVWIDGKLPAVVGNEAWLTQCLSNLLSNAIKFVPRGVTAKVKISAECLNGHVRIWIEDNGIGIDPRDQERIFRLFEKVHCAWEYEGTGIGLTIARKAVERMGGRIGFESELGQGSRFWIELKKA